MSFKALPFPEPVHVVPGQTYEVGIDPETGAPFCRPSSEGIVKFSQDGTLTELLSYKGSPQVLGWDEPQPLPHWADLLSPVEQPHEQEGRDCC